MTRIERNKEINKHVNENIRQKEMKDKMKKLFFFFAEIIRKKKKFNKNVSDKNILKNKYVRKTQVVLATKAFRE